jgi:hypothetical protein
MERWGQYFKPAGMSQNTGDPVKQTPKVSAPVDDIEEDEAPVAKATVAPAPKAETTTAPAGGDSRAQDILAMIRNRQKA